MRLDNFISDLGIVKRRTVAKELADGGHVKVNERTVKPSYNVKVGDIVEITGKRQVKLRVKEVPATGSIPKRERGKFFELLSGGPAELDI